MHDTLPAAAECARRVFPQPDIDAALSAFAPPQRRKAAGVLRSALAERLSRGSAADWQHSRLTGDGFPFELAFSSTDMRLRCTVEPGTADTDPRHRLGLANRLLERLGGHGLAPEVRGAPTAMQARGALRYGAWLGCRIGAEDDDVFKVYIEVPEGTPPEGMEGLDPVSVPPIGRAVALRMLAWTPATQQRETYLRVPSLTPAELPAVLQTVGLAQHSDAVLDCVAQAYGHRLGVRLPGPSIGVSIVSGGPERRLTLHFYARALWGSDARIRRGYTQLAQALGAAVHPTYLAASAPLAQRESWQCLHGLVGLTLSAAAPLAVGIGLRPVAA